MSLVTLSAIGAVIVVGSVVYALFSSRFTKPDGDDDRGDLPFGTRRKP